MNDLAKIAFAADKPQILSEQYVSVYFNKLDQSKSELEQFDAVKEIELFEVDYQGKIEAFVKRKIDAIQTS